VLAEFVDLAPVGPSLAATLGGPRHLAFVVRTTGGVVLTRSAKDATERFYGGAIVGEFGWKVSAGAKRSEALAAATMLSNRQIAVTAVALALVLLAMWWLHRRISTPLRVLSTSVRAATQDLSAPSPEVGAGPREVMSLAGDVNHLLEAARERERVEAARVALEEQLRRAERVDEQERELRLLADRERIGRDLHDIVIQRLFATGMSLESLTNRVGDQEVRDRLTASVDDIDMTIREVRNAIFAMEHDRGTDAEAAFVDLARGAYVTLGFEPSVEFDGPVASAIPPHVLDQMLATMRECLSNAARHSGATAVTVRVSVGKDIALVVRDDGQGIDREAAERGGGLGLRSMRARAERLGGVLHVERADEGGTVLAWRIPRENGGRADSS
jgi:signal transduction histidine kinase